MANIIDTTDSKKNSQAIADSLFDATQGKQPETIHIQPHMNQPTEPQNEIFNLDYSHLVGEDVGISKLYASVQLLQGRISKILKDPTQTQIGSSLSARKAYDAGSEKIMGDLEAIKAKNEEAMDKMVLSFLGAENMTAEQYPLTEIITISEQLAKGSPESIYTSLEENQSLRPYIYKYLKVFGDNQNALLAEALSDLTSTFKKTDADYQKKKEIFDAVPDLKTSFELLLQDQVGSGSLSFFKTGVMVAEENSLDRQLKDQKDSLDKQIKELEEKKKKLENK
jgi:hypothetical protein